MLCCVGVCPRFTLRLVVCCLFVVVVCSLFVDGCELLSVIRSL